MVKRLESAEIDNFLSGIDGWATVSGREAIEKKFQFKNFKQAFAFMTQVAMRAEQLQHHPEWFNVYNRVDVVLATHDCDGLSELDFKMAKFMNKIAA